MSRFNPNVDRSPEEWSALALRDNLSDRSGHLIVAGIVCGGLLASATTPLLGVVLTAYCITKGMQSAFASDKNKKLITHNGCVAHVLKPSEFRAYRRQVGDDKVLAELQFAEEEGMDLSIGAWEFLEEMAEKLNNLPALSETTISHRSDSVHQSNSGQEPTPTIIKTAVIDHYDPMANAKIDIIKEMAERINNTLIIGIPRSGKGMLVANALRAAKQKHPKLKVFVIDPKNDPKETGYFDCCDEVKAYACMDAKPSSVAAWAESAFDEYSLYASKNDQTLLIVDEGTMLGNKLAQAKSTLLVDKLTSYASGGDSAGRNIWFMMQSPYAGSASLNLSTTSQMTSIVIAFSENIGALSQWKSAKIFKELSLDTVSELIDKSETGRAVYYGKTGKWYMMPTLNNYSSYDRDNKEYLPGHDKKDAISVENLEAEFQQTVKQTNLSEPAQKIFEWLKEKRPKQWVKFKGKEERDMTFLNFLSDSSIKGEDRELLFQELETAGMIEFTPDGAYLRTM